MANLNLDPWQQDFIDREGDKILCCGRQVGKTEICSIDAGEWAIKNKNQVILMIAPTERQAYNLFDKTINYLLEKYPRFIKMGKDRPTKTKITLKNGTKIFCLPTGVAGVGIRGLTVGRLYVDETSRIPEEVWAAVTPMLLTTGGNMILLSTPHGAQGEFWRVWVNKDNAYESYSRFSVNSEDVIRKREISDTWTERQREGALRVIEQAKARLSNKLFAQEYMGEFIEDLFRYFSDDLIKSCCVLKRRENIQKGKQYFMGCDIARMGEDEGTFEIFEKVTSENIIQVENIVTRKKLTTETEDRIINLDRIYDFHFKESVGLDAGAGTLGVSIFDHLLRNDELRHKIVAINNRARSLDRSQTAKAKLLIEDLYDNTRSLMERGFVKLLDDDNLIESFRSIQYEFVETKLGRRMKIWGDYSHIVEGVNRALILANSKNLNIWISSIKP